MDHTGHENSDYDLLNSIAKASAEQGQDICWLKELMGNHLRHHWYITGGLILVFLIEVGTRIISWLTK